jgi:hypothetical protein
MPRFSLIVGTKDRAEEFTVLLNSLAEQQMRDFELVATDKAADTIRSGSQSLTSISRKLRPSSPPLDPR